MIANRGEGLVQAMKSTYSRGGISGFYQGLIPWAWIEASTKGGILLFASSEIDHLLKSKFNLSPSAAGVFSGMGGGVAQAYTTMGFCTFMKTVEVTRHKQVGIRQSTFSVAYEVFRKEGIVGLNRGVSAVALRQMTNWGSRFGISRVTESIMKGSDRSRKLSIPEKLSGKHKKVHIILLLLISSLASVIGGALGCWNQPIEVIRVEMQSQIKQPNRPDKMNLISTARYIYNQHGFLGFYRGITPRIGLSVYLTVCMVFGGDQIKERFAK